jgi:multimeric flavodoxin WrbA
MNKKKLLGLIASYRRTGNTEIVVKATAEKMDGWELSLIRLPALRIHPCKGCYACLMPGVQCSLDDDMQWLIERMIEADACIIAAPNYVLGPVGIMKMAADRALQTSPYHERLGSIKTAVAITLGREDYRGYSDTALVSQVMALGLKVASVELFHGTFPGEAVLEEGFSDRIERLAASLTSDGPVLSRPADRCPRCLSDLFRLRDGEIECALCKARAHREGDGLSFYYFHPEFGEEGQRLHLEWLVGKKEAYASMKSSLSEIQKRYRGGKWLTPQREDPA